MAADQEQVAALQKEVLVLRQKGEWLDTKQSAGEVCNIHASGRISFFLSFCGWDLQHMWSGRALVNWSI